MAIIGLSGEEQNDILRMLAAILWIGNVSYNERDDGNAEIADAGTVDFVAYLLEAPSELVSKVLTTKVVETTQLLTALLSILSPQDALDSIPPNVVNELIHLQ